MMNIFLTIIASILLLALLIHEKKKAGKVRLIAKTALSTLFVLVAFRQTPSIPTYSHYLIIGLLFCLGGDVCLALPGENIFKAGLLPFLLGHVFYVISFTFLLPVSEWLLGGAIPFWIFSFLIFLWLRPHLKSLLVPVVFYILVITLMTSGAWAVFSKSFLPLWGRVFILAGALFFYLSDVFVARNKFIKDNFLNRLIGLPLYYLGQFLLAFSVGIL